jgi:DNA-binding response OmpR family regulator
MGRRVLLVAEEIDLRAKIARGLHSSGYAVEIAGEMTRALRLVADNHFQMAIVAPGSSPANLPMMLELRDAVPEMIVLAARPEEIARLRRSLPGIETFELKQSNEGALIIRVGQLMALANSTPGEPALVPSILCIEDCRLDLAGHVFVAADGREVALTRSESDLLKELAHSPCQVLSREKLCHARRSPHGCASTGR